MGASFMYAPALRGARHRAKPARLMRSRGFLLLRAVGFVLHGDDAGGDIAAEHVADHLVFSTAGSGTLLISAR